MTALSANTKAILLLTAPLIVGRGSANPDLLSPGEYRRLAQHLHAVQSEPADLLAPGTTDLLVSCEALVDADRLRRLLGRGLQLSQAVERWQTRAIWVFSRADDEYPWRLKTVLRGDSPALLYGCGDMSLLNKGGLAVVGSRNVDDSLVEYTMEIGRLAAAAGATIVSGGAKGIDQAAMRGALEAGGQVCGVLADSLERQVMNREHRNMIMEGQLALVSPYDPNAGFNVGHAMQRNKSIYALADAALVASSDVDKGGTWAGAVEQLGKSNHAPIYVRSTGAPMPGLDALRKKGALAWPNPSDAEALRGLLSDRYAAVVQSELMLAEEAGQGERDRPREPFSAIATEARADRRSPDDGSCERIPDSASTPADIVFAGVQQAIRTLLTHPMKDGEVADALHVSTPQAKTWLSRLVDDGVLEKRKRPAGYALKDQHLFE